MFKVFIFVFYFLDLHKEQEKVAKMPYFFKLSCPLAHFSLLSKEAFVKSCCLKPHCVMCVRHVYILELSFGKTPYKYCLDGMFLGLFLGLSFSTNFD